MGERKCDCPRGVCLGYESEICAWPQMSEDAKLPEPAYPAMRAGLAPDMERVGWTESQIREITKQAAEAERAACIQFLMKLHDLEVSHNHFHWAANQLRERGTK